MKIVSAILFPLATGFAFLFLLLAWIVAFGGDLSIQLAGTAVVLVVVVAVGCWYRVAKRKQQADGPVRSSLDRPFGIAMIVCAIGVAALSVPLVLDCFRKGTAERVYAARNEHLESITKN